MSLLYLQVFGIPLSANFYAAQTHPRSVIVATQTRKLDNIN
jgi:hypothetical protein